MLSNGIVTAWICKKSGDIMSLLYKEVETLNQTRHIGGYWSHDTKGGKSVIARITIDPASNNGDRAEVSVKGISDGIKMGHGPGAPADGNFPADIDIRYTMEKGQPGIYTYCIFDHLPEYPAAQMVEARFHTKLAPMFDWISVDKYRNQYYPKALPLEDKYAFTANQWENRAFGFSSTTHKIGWWMINPSVEYLSGGPTKPEFLCHRDTNEIQAPCVLNYWRSSHYWGAVVHVSEGEHWTKVIGPFLMYINEGGDPNTLWDDAKARAKKEENRWPYDWVTDADYPHANERSDVRGKLILNDPLMPGGSRYIGKLMVGLAYPPYTSSSYYGGLREFGWQLDAKHYQFWVKVDDRSGEFVIPDVRPGTYTLYAFADGVLGEFTKSDIVIPEGGKPIDLGSLVWTPVRRGKQLWDIGIADRTAIEFVNGEKFFVPGIQLEYPELFPDDVHFVIGKSDFRKDWYFQHVPRNIDGKAAISPYRGVSGTGIAAPFTVHFQLSDAPKGKASLRLAICGTETKQIEVSVNKLKAGIVALGYPDGVISRHQILGGWYEREFVFDAAMMNKGENTLTLTVPAGTMNAGVIYDYLRLESDESYSN